MKVLVVGGAGYVGCVLVRELLSHGHEVRVYDRMFFDDGGLAGIRERVDVAIDAVRRISARHVVGNEAVINLAGISSDPTAEFKPDLTREMNVEGAVRLAEVCKEVGVHRYLFASSCSVYDSSQYDDESDVLLDESSPTVPVSTYARSKLEAERRLLHLSDDFFTLVILRKGTVYGYSPRMRFDLVINTFLKDALSRGYMTLHAGGETWRPVIGVKDTARAYVACLDAEEASVRREVFNVIFGNFRVSEMALRVRETLRKIDPTIDIRAEYTQERSRSYRVSEGKLGRVLGFRPAESIENVIEDAIYWLQRQGDIDFEHAKYYNTRLLDSLDKIQPLGSSFFN